MPVWRCMWTSRDFFVFNFLLHIGQGICASWWTVWCSCSTSLRWNLLLQISQANLRSPVVHIAITHLIYIAYSFYNIMYMKQRVLRFIRLLRHKIKFNIVISFIILQDVIYKYKDFTEQLIWIWRYNVHVYCSKTKISKHSGL